jgi:hypothetical protein
LEVAGVFEVEQHDRQSKASKVKFHRTAVSSHNYLDSQEYVRTAVTMNASTRYEFDLDQFNHTSAALLVCIRPTGYSNVGNGQQACRSLANGTIDIVGVSGESIYGGGRPVETNYIRKILAPRYVGSDYFGKNSVYPIMFGNFQKAMAGSIDGYQKFDGSKMRLQITTPNTATNAIITWTQSATPTVGAFHISYRGAKTRILQFNEPIVNIESAIDALNTVKEDDIKFSIGSLINAATTVSVTVTRKSTGTTYPESMIANDLIHLVPTGSLLATGTPVTSTSQASTAAVIGWLNTGVYDVSITSLYFKTIHQDGARLITEDA